MGKPIESNLSYLHTQDVTASSLESSPEGIILLSKISKVNQTTSEAELHTRPDYSLGREDSIHSVQFANLVIPRQSGVSTVQPIAIKPVMSAKDAIREHKVACYLNKQGEQLTFRPLGFTRWGG